VGTFLRWTGLTRRLLLLSVCLTLGSLLATVGERLNVGVSIAGVALWLLGFVGFCVFVRCPNCRERIVWRNVHNREADRKLSGLLMWTRCPFCGFSAQDVSVTDESAGTMITLTTPVQRLDGRLVLLIPLDNAGKLLAQSVRGIAHLRDDRLCVEIPEWLSGVLRVEEGDRVTVDNAGGRFNIRAVNARPVH
jgi:hypothetical protein